MRRSRRATPDWRLATSDLLSTFQTLPFSPFCFINQYVRTIPKRFITIPFFDGIAP
jgi:hypothetical protein